MHRTAERQIESLIALTPEDLRDGHPISAGQAAGRSAHPGRAACVPWHAAKVGRAISSAEVPAEGQPAGRSLLGAFGAPVL